MFRSNHFLWINRNHQWKYGQKDLLCGEMPHHCFRNIGLCRCLAFSFQLEGRGHRNGQEVQGTLVFIFSFLFLFSASFNCKSNRIFCPPFTELTDVDLIWLEGEWPIELQKIIINLILKIRPLFFFKWEIERLYSVDTICTVEQSYTTTVNPLGR